MTYDYSSLIRGGYAHTYALVDFATGEVRTTSCDIGAVALRALYKRMDGILREARGTQEAHHLVLANCRTNQVIAEVKFFGDC